MEKIQSISTEELRFLVYWICKPNLTDDVDPAIELCERWGVTPREVRDELERRGELDVSIAFHAR